MSSCDVHRGGECGGRSARRGALVVSARAISRPEYGIDHLDCERHGATARDAHSGFVALRDRRDADRFRRGGGCSDRRESAIGSRAPSWRRRRSRSRAPETGPFGFSDAGQGQAPETGPFGFSDDGQGQAPETGPFGFSDAGQGQAPQAGACRSPAAGHGHASEARASRSPAAGHGHASEAGASGSPAAGHGGARGATCARQGACRRAAAPGGVTGRATVRSAVAACGVGHPQGRELAGTVAVSCEQWLVDAGDWDRQPTASPPRGAPRAESRVGFRVLATPCVACGQTAAWALTDDGRRRR